MSHQQRRRLAVAIVLAAFAWPAVVMVQSGADGSAPAGRNWPASGGDLASTRYSTLNLITVWGGELRPGDNLFTAAVVARDLRTGK